MKYALMKRFNKYLTYSQERMLKSAAVSFSSFHLFLSCIYFPRTKEHVCAIVKAFLHYIVQNLGEAKDYVKAEELLAVYSNTPRICKYLNQVSKNSTVYFILNLPKLQNILVAKEM